MKTNLTLFLFVMGLSPLVVRAESAASQLTPASPEAQPAEEKSHTLFMGADFAVKFKDAMEPVKRVEYGHFIVQVKDRLEKVPVDRAGLSIRIDPSLKLTERRATIDQWKIDRDYSPGNDPRTKWATNQITLMDHQSDQLAMARRQIQGGPTYVRSEMKDGKIVSETLPRPEFEKGMRTMENSFTNSMPHDMIRKGEDEAGEENFDAVRASFKVSAPKRLGHPYIVLVARYKERDEAGKEGNWIYARALDVVDETPRTVRILQGGLPVGFILEGATLHLYDGETEIATDVSDKQVRFTRAQAHQFVAGQYVVANKGKTLPATSTNLEAVLKSISAERPVWVRVGRDGLPKGAFTDEACTESAPFQVQDALKRVQFFPALEKGKPVEGLVCLKA